jgi:hypothetical protein
MNLQNKRINLDSVYLATYFSHYLSDDEFMEQLYTVCTMFAIYLTQSL